MTTAHGVPSPTPCLEIALHTVFVDGINFAKNSKNVSRKFIFVFLCGLSSQHVAAATYGKKEKLNI